MTKDDQERVRELRIWIKEANDFICLIRHRSDEYEAWIDRIAGYRREIESIENRYA